MFISKRCSCLDSHIKTNKNENSDLVKLLKLASVPARLQILFLLEKKPHCVCDIQTHTDLSQSLISHHLSDLSDANLIKSFKYGKFVDYGLTEKGKKLVKTLKQIE